MEQRHTYGGQAVLEGVMIRGQRHFSIAVRRPDGTIAHQSEQINLLFTGRRSDRQYRRSRGRR